MVAEHREEAVPRRAPEQAEEGQTEERDQPDDADNDCERGRRVRCASLPARAHSGRKPNLFTNSLLLAKGTNPNEGGSEIVYHEPQGGGAVFSVGSITWISALFCDAHVSAITRNVLRRFL